MDYVEFSRVRRALTIFATTIVFVAIVVVLSIHFGTARGGTGHVSVTVGSDVVSGVSARDAMSRVAVPLELLVAIAGFGAILAASFFASSLNKENDGANFVFVKPIARERLALQYMAIDACGILVAFVFTLATALAVLASLGMSAHIVFGARALWVAALELGVAFMYYGIMQAITAGYRGKGGTLVGWSWPVFIGLAGGAQATFLGPIVVGIIRALDTFNPVVYLPSISSSHGQTSVYTELGSSLQANVPVVWTIAFVMCALAIQRWKRLEV